MDLLPACLFRWIRGARYICFQGVRGAAEFTAAGPLTILCLLYHQLTKDEMDAQAGSLSKNSHLCAVLMFSPQLASYQRND
jgi:hypothetical protein